jgi:hypothetical protein
MRRVCTGSLQLVPLTLFAKRQIYPIGPSIPSYALRSLNLMPKMTQKRFTGYWRLCTSTDKLSVASGCDFWKTNKGELHSVFLCIPYQSRGPCHDWFQTYEDWAADAIFVHGLNILPRRNLTILKQR